MKASWKTSLGGVGMILAGGGALLQKYANEGFFACLGDTYNIGILLGGIGLVFARDNKRSDQDAGARPEPEVRKAIPVGPPSKRYP